VRCIGQEELPDEWDIYPHAVASRGLVALVFANSTSVALSVPSALVPLDRTLVLKSYRLESGKLGIRHNLLFSFEHRALA
jgi:hypothetical protein